MYLRKVEGPRTVTLPDGSTMSRADMPSPSSRHWVASRKAAVVRGVSAGLMSLNEALEIYGLSEAEFEEWRNAVETFGEAALKATAVQKYRQL